MQSALAQDRACYGINGVELDNSFAPCNRNASTHSGCCATNRTSGSPDLCLSNGLCMATNDEFTGTIWQTACTDPTGKDPACPKTCPDALPDGTKVLAWNIQMCDYGSYCCREASDRSSCCTNATIPRISTPSLGSIILPAIPSTSSTPSSSSSPTTSPSPSSPSSQAPDPTQTTTTPEPALSPPPTTPAPETLCAAEKQKTANLVGGAVGGITGAALVALVALVLWMHRKEKRQRVLKEHYEEQFRNSYKHRPGRGGAGGAGVGVVVVDADDEEEDGDGDGKGVKG